ncbi:MAG: RNA methyltransferase PUA domain-containing protein, partial [Myxococcota bacterium]
MSQFWAWVEDLAASGPYELSSEEVRHAASRRLRVGDELVVFDAKGRLASARVEGLGRGSTRLEVGAIRTVPSPNSGFGLAPAIPTAQRLSTMLQMWTQLGLEIWLSYGDREAGRADFELSSGWVFIGPEAGFTRA